MDTAGERGTATVMMTGRACVTTLHRRLSSDRALRHAIYERPAAGWGELRSGFGLACRRSPESAAARDQPRNPKTGRPAVSAAVTRMKTPRSDGCSVAERSWKLA